MDHFKKQSGFALPIAILIAVVLIIAGGILAWQYFGEREPYIKVLSPNGGEVWEVDSTQAIQWATRNIPPTNKISVHIRRVPPPPLLTEGQEFDPVIFIELENDGSEDWTISDMYPPGNYLIEVNSYPSVPITNAVSDESDAPFKIVSSSGETANWETYRNEEYGFEVKYPPVDWRVTEFTPEYMAQLGGEHWEKFEKKDWERTGKLVEIDIGDSAGFHAAEIQIFRETIYLETLVSLDGYDRLRSFIEKWYGVPLHEVAPIGEAMERGLYEEKEYYIEDQEAIEIRYITRGEYPSLQEVVEKKVFTANKGLLFGITYSDEIEEYQICDQILSTFKFIELEKPEEEAPEVEEAPKVEEKPAAPNTPIMLDIDVSTAAGSPYTIGWRAIEEAENYILERDISSSFSNPIVVSSRTLNRFSETLSPSVSTRYYFRVKACNKYGCSFWSKITELWVEVPPSITVTFPNGGESINQESCKIQWDSKNVKLIDVLLLVYDENKNQLICYRNPIGTGFGVISEVPIAAFKQGAKAEDGYYLASFKQELEENCSFVIPPAYYKIKLRESYVGEAVDTSDGYFTISPGPNFKIISVNNEVQLRGGVNPLNWENHTFVIGNDIILTDNSTKFYLDGKEITFEKLKQIYDEMGENKYCPFGSCPFNSLNGNIKAISSQGQITIMAKEIVFSGGQ